MKPALPDIQDLWNFNEPAVTETRFREILPAAEAAEDADYRLQLLTQIARTYSLRREFDQAHEQLDSVEQELTSQTPIARIRYLLERGRTFNSSGKKDKARPIFIEAWEGGKAICQHGLAVDAAHMVAIAETGDEVLNWNLTALKFAEESDQPKGRKWLASLYNNIGWTHHSAGDFVQALDCFEKALIEQQNKGDQELINVARWCIARCLRSLGRLDEALVQQRELELESGEKAKSDGFVQEEIAECLYALGQADAARPYFHRAHEVLSKDAWLMDSEPDRIKRLQMLSRDED